MGKVLEAQGVKPITIDDTDSASWRLDLSNEISWERLKHEVMLHRPRGIFALPPLIGHNKNTDAGKRVRAVWILLLQFADWAASSQYIPTILYFDACHDASRDTHKFLLDHSSGFSIFRLHCCDKKARQHHEVYTVITGTEYNGSILSSECTLPTHNQLVSPMPGRSPPFKIMVKTLRAVKLFSGEISFGVQPFKFLSPLDRESRKKRRELENTQCVGGMRNNSHNNPTYNRAAVRLGNKIRHIAEECEGLRDFVKLVMSGEPASSPPRLEESVAAVRRLLGSSPDEAGLSPSFIDAANCMLSDPDDTLSSWLRNGAPLGIEQRIANKNIFPVVAEESHYQSIGDIRFKQHEGWANYISAEAAPDIVQNILDKMVHNNWAVQFDSVEEVQSFTGSKEFCVNKIALISKEKPDGTMKHRVIWDFRRSQVNSLIRLGERIVLPRFSDLLEDIQAGNRAPRPGNDVFLFGTDISDAFHNVPLHKSEKKYTITIFQGKYYAFNVLVFGSASAPTVWGRFAAWLGRTLKKVFPEVGTQIYVDDPIFVSHGTIKSAISDFSCVLLWMAAAGFPIAWNKCAGGNRLQWIGVVIQAAKDHTIVTVPVDTCMDVVSELRAIASLSRVNIGRIQSLAGKLSFISQFLNTIKPFLAAFWKTLEIHPSLRKQDFVATKGLVHSCSILMGFFSNPSAPYSKCIPHTEPTTTWTIHIDASPYGIGGVLCVSGVPVEFFADVITHHDKNILKNDGTSYRSQSIWELLALTVALSSWVPRFQRCPVKICVSSDSIATIGAFNKESSRSPSMSILLREIALYRSMAPAVPIFVKHVPGAANSWPDSLSRLHAPQPSTIPDELLALPRANLVPRDKFWYKSRTLKLIHIERLSYRYSEKIRVTHISLSVIVAMS